MRLLIALILSAMAANAAGYTYVTTDPASGFNNVAYFAYTQGHPEAAEHLFREAIAIDDAYELPRYNLATLLFEQQRFEEATAELRILLELDSDRPAYHYDLAINLVEDIRQNLHGLEHFEEAIDHFAVAESLSPGFEHAAENIEVLRRFVIVK